MLCRLMSFSLCFPLLNPSHNTTLATLLSTFRLRHLIRVNSRSLQSQCLAINAFCKAPPKNKFYLSFGRDRRAVSIRQNRGEYAYLLKRVRALTGV